MTEPSKQRCRRSFLKFVGYATAGAAFVLGGKVVTGSVWAEEPATPTTKPDLVLKHAILSGQRLPVVASTSYLEVHSVRLRGTSRRGCFRVQYRFTSRAVEGAHFKLALLGRDAQVVAAAVHKEDVGPEEAPAPRFGVRLASAWHRDRDLGLNLPLDALEGTASFSLEIRSY